MKQIIEKLKKDKYYVSMIIFVVLILILVSVPLLWVQFSKINSSYIDDVYSVKAIKSANDKVLLKSNDIFINNSDGYYKNDFYIANLIDKFNIQYNDTIYFSGVDTINATLTSIVLADLTVTSENGEILREAQSIQAPGYVFREDKSCTQLTDNRISFSKNVEMEYSTFKTRFAQIKSKLTGVDCKGYISIRYIVRVSGTIDEQSVNYEEVISSEIPIVDNGTIDISHVVPADYVKEINEVYYRNESNIFAIIFAFILITIALALLILVIILYVQVLQQNKKQRQITKPIPFTQVIFKITIQYI